MIHKVVRFFDKLEDKVRGRLSRYPILYTIIGGTAIVLFWRGVWIVADNVMLLLPPQYAWIDGPVSVVSSVLILLVTGLFVAFFISDQTILTGLKQEKKLVEKAEEEVQQESIALQDISKKVDHIEEELQQIGDKLS